MLGPDVQESKPALSRWQRWYRAAHAANTPAYQRWRVVQRASYHHRKEARRLASQFAQHGPRMARALRRLRNRERASAAGLTPSAALLVRICSPVAEADIA